MAGKFMRAALEDLLEDTKADRNTYHLGLYVNDPAITDALVIGDLTEASFGGYGRILVNSWGGAFLNPINIAESDEILRTFTVTGAPLTQTVFGYFLVDTFGDLVAAERNPAGGVAMNAVGVVYPVWLRVTLENG